MENVIRCESNFEKVESPNFFRFIKEYGVRVENNQLSGVSYIPLHFLREVYGKEKALFFRLIKEFGLRGYEVIADNNDIFYNDIVAFDKRERNRVLHNINLSEKYSFERIVLPPSIQTFLSESSVRSSGFFDGILVDNLFKVFPGTDESLLTVLSRIGVVVSDDGEVLTGQFDEVFRVPLSATEREQVHIASLFDPDHNLMIIDAFKKNGIEMIDDITIKKLQAVFETKGIGKKKKEFIQKILHPYIDDSPQHVEPQKDKINYIRVFPEIIFHSCSTRQMFANSSQVELKCTEDGQVSDCDLMFLNLNTKLKGYKVLKKSIEKDITSYLGHASEYVEPLLEEKQVNLLIKNFEFSGDLLEAISNFSKVQRQEFYKELNYELSFTLDKRLDVVESEFAKSISEKKHWSVIEDIMISDSTSTLQKIGDEIGLTRERVRQIKVKICSLKRNLVKGYRIEQFLCLSQFAKNQPLAFIDELDNRISGLLKNIESRLIIQPNNKDRTPFIIFNQVKETLDEMNDWVDRLQNENKLNTDTLWNFFKSFGGGRSEQPFKKQLVDKILKTYHYDYVFPSFACKRMNKAQIVYRIYIEKFGNEFSIYDLPFTILNQEYKSVTGNDLFTPAHKQNSERLVNNMLLRIVSNTPGILYIGGGEYEEDPSGKIDDTFFEEAKLFILKSLQEVASIKINKVYSHFQSYLTSVGISSPRELYFILKEHLSEFFSYAEGNELNIWKMDADKISNEQILTDLIINNGSRMRESDIFEKLGWTQSSIEQTVYGSSDLRYGKGEVYVPDRSIPLKIHEFISDEVSKQTAIHSDYVLVQRIQQNLKNNWELLKEIPNIEILTNLDMFADLIKVIDNDWKGYSQVLYKDQQIDVSIVLHDHFGNEPFDKDQYNDFLKDLGYKPSTISLKLNKLILNSVIAKVGPDRLMFTGILNIQIEDQSRIDKYLLGMLSNERYISLAHELINGAILPEIAGLMWTRELLFYFASNSSSVKTLNWPQDTGIISLPINPMIVVNRADSMDSLLDLTKYCIENFVGNRSVVNVKNYLAKRNILIGKTNNGTLPEILNPIIFVDDDGVVHLKEQEAKK